MTKYKGLSTTEAAVLLVNHGPNELPSSKRKSYFAIVLQIVREPMILLLISCVVIYALMGDIEDSILLSLSVFLVIGITLYQEARSSRALESLRELSSPRALVIRDGVETRIAAREVVPGDLLVLNEGDRVAADGILIEAVNFESNESLLTGESLPVPKEKNDSVFSSTLVTAGFAVAKVSATGSSTEVGHIGRVLFHGEEPPTRLQLEIAKLIKTFGIMAILFSSMIVVAFGITRGDWPEGFLAGISAAMALLPEEFPVIMTVFLALGAWRMSRTNVLVRQSTATENLGAVTVLCVDKTGTLTLNRMTVKFCVGVGQFSDEAALRIAFLACRPNSVDPMEKAIATRYSQQQVHEQFTIVKEYGLSAELLAMTNVIKSQGHSFYASKGAPEAIAALCGSEQSVSLLEQSSQLTQQGYRVLALATAEAEGPLPKQHSDLKLKLVGFIALEDPVRVEAKAALEECRSAGVRVIMMTGDHPNTAVKIAHEIGLQTSKVLTGKQLLDFSDSELDLELKDVNVFARMIPEHKLRVISLLKRNGQVVAMTGDGVNDAPSLKSADIGIAMGGRGTDVAREASDIVLLDDNFASIVAGIRQGRRIFHNIQRAMSYIFAIHVPIAGLAIVPILSGLPLALYPIHIVFLELIIDPACTLVYEGEPDDESSMRRPPRNLSLPLFGLKNILSSSAEGLATFVVIFGLYFGMLSNGSTSEVARAIAFTCFVISNVGLILIHRGKITELKQNKSFRWVALIAFTSLALSLSVPQFRKVFGFSAIQLSDLLIAMCASLIALTLTKLLKELSRQPRIS